MRKLPSTFSPSCLFKVLVLIFYTILQVFYSVGPVVNCHMPKDRVTQTHQGYGFVEFLSEDDADYAIKILNMIKLFGKPGFSFLLSTFYNRVSQFA
jgi:RNA recognition motif-containing protein